MDTIIENKLSISTDNRILQLLNRYQETCIELVLESIRQNFKEYINQRVEYIDHFLEGAKRGSISLFNTLKEDYIEGNKIRKDLLRNVTKHRFNKEEISYEEIIIDFPIGHALFDLNLAYHSGFFKNRYLTDKQKDEFSKGLCLSSHMLTFMIYIFFRHEIFQDITFLRFMKGFKNHNFFVPYPASTKDFLYKRIDKFGWFLILNQSSSESD